MIGLNQINGNTTLLHELINYNINFQILVTGAETSREIDNMIAFFSCNKVVIAWIRN